MSPLLFLAGNSENVGTLFIFNGLWASKVGTGFGATWERASFQWLKTFTDGNRLGLSRAFEGLGANIDGANKQKAPPGRGLNSRYSRFAITHPQRPARAGLKCRFDRLRARVIG